MMWLIKFLFWRDPLSGVLFVVSPLCFGAAIYVLSL